MNRHGLQAKHVIITSNCRDIQRLGYTPFKAEPAIQQDKDNFALERAVELIHKQYKESLKGWREQGVEPTFNLVLYVERPEKK